MKNYFWIAILGAFVLCSEIQAELVDNGDGTVTDTVHGLMWHQEEAGAMTWEAALSYCETLVFPQDGYDDWRLSNRNELQSLVDYSKYNPAIDINLFPDAAPDCCYWSSTTSANHTDKAWFVNFRGGNIADSYAKYESLHVRAVRNLQ